MSQTHNLEKSSPELGNTSKLQQAKKELNLIQERFQKFKSKSREHIENQSHMPKGSNIRFVSTEKPQRSQNSFLPDLKQYFSFMTQKQNIPGSENIKRKNEDQNQRLRGQNKKFQANFVTQTTLNDNKRQIQQRLRNQKDEAIKNLEQFYKMKKAQIQKNIQHLQQSREKAVKDQNLFQLSNSQLKRQIQMEKQLLQNQITDGINEKNSQIQSKIKLKIQQLEKIRINIDRTKARNEQIKRNIAQCFKTSRNIISNHN